MAEGWKIVPNSPAATPSARISEYCRRQSDGENGGGVAEQADGQKSFAAESIGGKPGGIAGEIVDRAVEGDDQRRRADAGKFQIGRNAKIERDQHRSIGVGEAVKNRAEGESQMTSGENRGDSSAPQHVEKRLSVHFDLVGAQSFDAGEAGFIGGGLQGHLFEG